MLRVQYDSVTTSAVQVQTDFYVPMDVAVEGDVAEVAAYWRTGDLEHSLVEVGFNRRSGRFRSVTATLVPPKAAVRVAEAPGAQPAQPGIPVFDCGALSGHHSDEKGDFLLRVGADFVWLDLAPQVSHLRELRHGRLRFLLGVGDVWQGLVVEGLTQPELAELWEGIHREGGGE